LHLKLLGRGWDFTSIIIAIAGPQSYQYWIQGHNRTSSLAVRACSSTEVEADFAPPVERKEQLMRSDLIFGALTHVTNRYELCQLASKATRKLHKPNTRLQDTTNEVLDRFKDTIPKDEATAPSVRSADLQERRAA
jgi:hypothetical protein